MKINLSNPKLFKILVGLLYLNIKILMYGNV